MWKTPETARYAAVVARTAATQARHVAVTLDDASTANLLQIAEELDKEAGELEREAELLAQSTRRV
jgi:hypothetical protein